MNRKIIPNGIIASSFRDPSGFLFFHDGMLYRQIEPGYRENYDYLMQSGLYRALVEAGLLIAHEEVEQSPAVSETAYKILWPDLIPFITYPYEWCFSQFKQAALVTLRVQQTALEFGMSLKDCSAYNVQFQGCRPVFIDTLSFEKYREGRPWIAYGQFCQHFLAPLAMMSYTDIRLNQLLRIYMDGIPLDLASALLPWSSRLRFSILAHIHLHAKSQKHYADKELSEAAREQKLSRNALRGLIQSLTAAVTQLRWKPQGTAWSEYYMDTNYSTQGFEHKKQLVADFLERARPQRVLDLGANLGIFSRISSERGILTISADLDPAAVEKNYLESLVKNETHLLPVLLDLKNPSPGIGWENQERMLFLERAPADLVMALALVHHLAIANNLPLGKVSEFFKELCQWLIIEFVPKSDSQVQRLLRSREDIFPDYKQDAFESAFGRIFNLVDAVRIQGTERTLYLMQKR